MTEQRGFTGTYDAAGHRADVIALLQGGKTGDELMAFAASATRALTDDEVLEIRAAYQYGSHDANTRTLASQYGVSRETIRSLVTGLTYKAVAA